MSRFALLIISLALCSSLTNEGRAQAKIFRNGITNDVLEKVLQSMELKYSKAERKDKEGIMFFDFTRGDRSYRLYNYNSDLWLESTFDKKMKLEDINRWNADAKFSRLVLLELKDKTTISLESQLDCLGGVTDNLIKQYINRFDEEAKKFAKFAK